MNLIFTNSPPVFHHQGGWDEMLMFLIPALLLTWLRKNKIQTILKMNDIKYN